MENTVTISLNEYKELSDAKKALSDITKDWTQIYYLAIEDCVGKYHVIKSDNDVLIKMDNTLKERNKMVNEERNKYIDIMNTLIKLEANVIRFNELPWYKRIFKKI